jgi:homocitrate synthase NifV
MPHNVSVLARFLELLIQTEPDAIELSQKMFHLLSPLPDYPGYLIRIDRIEDAEKYPSAAGFVCPNAPADCGKKVINEIVLNDIDNVDAANCGNGGIVRVQGLDNIITGDYLNMFARLRKRFSGGIEFCPANRYNFAAALSAEWLTNGGAINGGNRIAASFGGIGCFAPTEEIIMILKLAKLRKADKIYGFFPEMASLFNKITGKPVRCNKPVLGGRIFHVESGIHVDGILKDPTCYEPFPPETVGLKREIVIGRQSGAASIKAKLAELGISCAQEKIPAVIEGVRAKSDEKRGALTNQEFAEVVRGCAA